jgi:hypothetical protein
MSILPNKGLPGPGELTTSEKMRLQYLIIEIISKSFNKLKRNVKSEFNQFSFHTAKQMEKLIEDVVARECNKLLSAAKVKPDVHKLIAEIKRRRKESRSLLADELRSSKNKLRTLQRKIGNAEAEATRLVKEKETMMRKDVAQRLKSGREKLKRLNQNYNDISETWFDNRSQAKGEQYPPIPLPQINPDGQGAGLPRASGIYFLWDENEIVYVGQARKLCDRLRLGSHHVMTEHHRISFVFTKTHELNWAEGYYVGISKPRLNFGKRAAHYKGDDE